MLVPGHGMDAGQADTTDDHPPASLLGGYFLGEEAEGQAGIMASKGHIAC